MSVRLSTFIAMRLPRVTHNALVVRRSKKGGTWIGKSAALVAAEDSYLSHMTHEARPSTPLGNDGTPLAVSLVWSYLSGGVRRDGEPKATKPDLDNMAKTVLDCMTRAGIIADDALVCDLSLAKVYGPVEGLHVEVTEIETNER